MNDQIVKDLHLHDELLTSFQLIKIGFHELQLLDLANDFYHIPFQLLSSGFERLMKCHICLGYLEKKKAYPDYKYLKKSGGKNGHDLIELKNTIINFYFRKNNIPALIADYEYLSKDKELNQLIFLLSQFGQYSRYYNLDVVTSAAKQSIDVTSLWSEYELKLIHSKPDLFNQLNDINKSKEINDTVNKEIIIKSEKFSRAICRQFTLGNLGKKALQFSPVIFPLIKIMDSDLGKTKY